MKFLVLFFGIFISMASPSVLHAEGVLHVGGFSGLGAATDVAERKGFLEAEDMTLEFDRVDTSIELMTNFISGKYDIIQTNADTIIAWAEGKGGALVRLESSTHRLKEFVAPLLYYGSFYEANPDKNGEVWAGAVQTGRYSRLDPKTERWINYVLPEPYSHNRKSWIDNSTDPVSLWYVDHNSYLVHIQPRQ